MKKLLAGLLLSICIGTVAQTNITPMPAEIRMGKGSFNLNKNTIIVLEGSNMEKSVAFFNAHLQKLYGYQLKTIKNSSSTNAIRLNYERLDAALPGAYNLTVDKNGVYIAGDNEEGVFYGIQTLIQLIPVSTTDSRPPTTSAPISIPYLSINDFPRFAYRGMHLDVARHIFPVDFIKKYIDYLAAYKYNNFHWHLTDDQGWRIEIKKYPLLTEKGSCRDQTLVGNYGSNKYDGEKYCGYYTQLQIKEIVKYAADRYINIIPEIEMPGHAVAALAAYPYLGCTKGLYRVMETWGVSDDVFCAGNDSTYTFLQDVLDEVLQLFPSKYIHVGGDECPKERWMTCPVCKQRMQQENLKDEHELQSYFIKRIERYLNSKGRKIIGWDEILEGGLAPNATVMSWQGEEGGIAAAKLNHNVIMTPGSHCYFDNSQGKNEDSTNQGGYIPLEKVYGYEPIPAALKGAGMKYILGAQGNVWTEYMTNPSKVEYMIFPRIIALSEVLWSPAAKRDWKDFEQRLPGIFARLDEQNINYSKAYYDLEATVVPGENGEGVRVVLESNLPGSDIRYRYNNSEFHPYKGPVGLDKNVELGFSVFKNDRPIRIGTQHFYFNKATGKKISLKNQPDTRYPGNGAFTLVDAVQNEKGFAKASEFLGFLGTDLEATIDLGKTTPVSEIRIHSLSQTGSWIYPPGQRVSVLISDDGINFTAPGNEYHTIPDGPLTKIWFSLGHEVINTRYLKVIAPNYGIIPPDNPGAGNPAWLFVDEIEVF